MKKTRSRKSRDTVPLSDFHMIGAWNSIYLPKTAASMLFETSTVF